MAAPAVQSLQDIIGSIQQAQQPEQAQIDQNISANDTSGQAQVQGLDAAQNNAFSKINQEASNKGMYFSGYTPSSEAAYTGATYLPALAKVQQAIATTRNTLMGQKATLATQANTQALTTQQDQQKELDAYNSQQQSEAAAAALETQREQAATQAASIKASSAVPSAAAQKAAALASLQGDLNNAFTGFGVRPSFYTEQTIIPKLLQAYAGSGLSNQDIINATYATRKGLGFG